MGMRIVKRATLLCPLLLLLALQYGCSATTPAALRDAPKESPALGKVLAQPDTYIETRLRWGGTIVRTENLPQTTRIEVVARRLYNDGEPMHEDSSEGRFIAQFDLFLDPTIYSAGRAITVVGRLATIEERQLDQMHYRYPLLRVESHHLWPEPEPLQQRYGPYLNDPFFYDPFFYDPWYPFGYPYPYYPRHRYWPYYR